MIDLTGLRNAQISDCLKGPVDGLGEYKLALKKQAIRGKTLLAAMRVAQDATQLYYQQAAEKVERAKREAELNKVAEAVAAKTASDNRLRNLTRLAYQTRLRSLRRGLYLMLHQYALAYVYKAGSPEFPEGVKNMGKTDADNPVRADLDVEKFKALYLALDGRVNKATEGEANRQQTSRDMIVNTTEHSNTVFRPEWRDLAIPDGLITFTIPFKLLEPANLYYRLRVMKVK